MTSNQSSVWSASSSHGDARLSEPLAPSASLSLPPLHLHPLHSLFLPSLRFIPAPARPAGVSNLWFNKTYISLAGVLYVPQPSPFGGFMEGLWITGWFRSPPLQPLACPVHRTPPWRLSDRPNVGQNGGRRGRGCLVGDVAAKETVTP